METRQTQNSCFKHCILCSVNKLARAVTKWNQACDRRFARLISFIHRTNDFRQHCHVGNPAQHRRLGVFQDSAFTGDHENSKPISMEFSVSSGVEHSFPQVGCARNKLQSHTVLSNLKRHRWMQVYVDGIPALDLWHDPSIQPRARCNLLRDKHSKTFQRKNEETV